MLDLNIQLPELFFQEEVRDGYLVSSKMKELWAVQLDLLNELDRVCKKHGLKYSLDFGTLLGAVRHKGFIPWDDDLDVSMLREDFDKLMEIGPTEFKNPYFLQNPITDKNYDDCVTKLRRSDTCCLLSNAVDMYGRKKAYNQGIFIDIFVLDHVPDSETETIKKLSDESYDAYYRMGVLSHFPKFNGNLSIFLSGFGSYMYNKIRFGTIRGVYRRLERQVKSRPKSGIVGTATFMPTYCRPLNDYETIIEMPFEQMMCPVPGGYDEVLRLLYGDYMTPVKGSSGHSIVYFDVNRPYQDVLDDRKLISQLRSHFK